MEYETKTQWINYKFYSTLVSPIFFQFWITMKLGDNLKNPMWNLFLWIGTTLATLSIVEKIPVENEMLNVSPKLVKIFLSSFNILVAMILSQTDLFEFREDITLCISDLL